MRMNKGIPQLLPGLALLLLLLAPGAAAAASAAGEGSYISGTVYDAEGGFAEDVDIEVRSGDEVVWQQHYLIPGPYRVGPLPAGSYAVTARGRDLARQVYPDFICQTSCTLADGGEAVVVGRNEERTGIDFHLHRLGSLAGRVVDAGAAARALPAPWCGSTTRPSGCRSAFISRSRGAASWRRGWRREATW